MGTTQLPRRARQRALCLGLVPLAWGLLACGGGAESPQSPTTLGTTAAPTTTNADGSSSGPDANACTPGTQISCMCLGGGTSFQICNDAGSGYGECLCEEPTTGPDPSDADSSGDGSSGEVEPCGDTVCDADGGEDCATCEADCGVCEPCDQAPSCEGAEIPPIIETHAAFLDDPMAYIPPSEALDQLTAAVGQGGLDARLIAAALDAEHPGEPAFVGLLRDVFADHPGATARVREAFASAGMSDPGAYLSQHGAPSQAELTALALPAPDSLGSGSDPMLAPCDNPRMRIRVARLTVHEEDDDFLNDEVYCAITTEAADHAEIKVTPLTTALDEGDSIDYSLDGGLIWGQGELTAPMGNILITYNCIESEGSGEGYAGLLGALGDAVGEFDGESVGADGWVFPAAGVVTNLLASSLTLDGDDLLFNGSQNIPATEMLPLTYGAWWSVRREGTNLNSDWDWELRMEIWGCHDYGTGMPPAG